MDINSLIAKYLANNNEADLSKVSSSIQNLKDDLNIGGRYDELVASIFTSTEDVSEESFISFISQATGKDTSEIEDDASTLFSILDQDGGADGKLSSDELDIFSDGKSSFDAFRFTDELCCFNEERVADILAEKKLTDKKTDSKDSTDSTDSTETESSKDTDETSKTSDSDDNKTGDNKTNSLNTASYDFTDEEQAKAFVESLIDGDIFKTAEDVIDYLAGTTLISSKDLDKIKEAYGLSSNSTSKSDEEDEDSSSKPSSSEDSGKTNGTSSSGGTDKTEGTSTSNGSGETNGTSSSNGNNNQVGSSSNASTNKVDTAECAKMLHEAMDGLGTNESDLFLILDELDMSNEDFVNVVQTYEEFYGLGAGKKGLVTRIEQDTSGKTQKNLTELLGQKLLAAASDPNCANQEEAIELLCKEIYSGTAGQNLTANHFISAVFDNAPNEVIKQIVDKYSEVNSGRDILEDIDADYSGSEGEKLMNKIKAARLQL